MNAKSKMNDFNLLQVLLTLDPAQATSTFTSASSCASACSGRLSVHVCVCVRMRVWMLFI